MPIATRRVFPIHTVLQKSHKPVMQLCMGTGWEGIGWFIRTEEEVGISPRDVSASSVLPDENVFLTRTTGLGFASNLVPNCAGMQLFPVLCEALTP